MQNPYYWVPVPGVDIHAPLTGKLIVLEGTDGVGRSTQTRMMRNWLESSGLPVHDTGLRRGTLAGRHIREAKEGHTMGRHTQCLFYATDFADRLQNEIIPALRSGYIVLTDRYIYSLIARAAVRGLDRDWLRKLYGFAARPDLILYLNTSIDKLLPRVLASGGFDYWESGMDHLGEESMYDAFVKYQSALLEEFEQLSEEYGFVAIDAGRSIGEVFADLKHKVKAVVEEMTPRAHEFTEFVGEIGPPRDPDDEETGSMAERLRDLLFSFLEDK